MWLFFIIFYFNLCKLFMLNAPYSPGKSLRHWQIYSTPWLLLFHSIICFHLFITSIMLSSESMFILILVENYNKIMFFSNIWSCSLIEYTGIVTTALSKYNDNSVQIIVWFMTLGHTEFKVNVAYRFLTSMDSYRTISASFLLGSSTVIIVSEVCSAIWNAMWETYLPLPSGTHWCNIAKDFACIWQLPNCARTHDGKCTYL